MYTWCACAGVGGQDQCSHSRQWVPHTLVRGLDATHFRGQLGKLPAQGRAQVQSKPDLVHMEGFEEPPLCRRVEPSVVLDTMHNRLNKTQVVRAAIFDLLTSQCDRHAQVRSARLGLLSHNSMGLCCTPSMPLGTPAPLHLLTHITEHFHR